MVDLTRLTIAEASRLMMSKELSPVELTQAALQRISTLNPRLNAFITVLEDRARATAKAAEQEMMSGQRRGPLHGIPIALKDLCATKGVRTTAGSKILRDHIPMDDATVTRRLAEAGTILLGKLHMNEFAYGPDGDNGALWAGAQSMGPGSHDRGVEQRFGGSAGGFNVFRGPGQRYRWLYSYSCRPMWHCRPQTHIRARQPLRPYPPQLVPRSCRANGQDGRRCRPTPASHGGL